MNVIITGATKGIGLATTQIFAQNQANLFLCARTEKDLKNLKDQLLTSYPSLEIHIKTTDVSKKEAVLDFAASIKNTWNHVDVLINNAGAYFPGNVVDAPDGLLESLLNTNLMSAYHLTRAMLPMLENRPKTHIFNLCSIASLGHLPGGSLYCISKFALNGLNQMLREELKDKKIRVTGIFPGATFTPSWDGTGIDPNRIMPAEDIALAIFSAWQMSDRTVVEDIILRPQLGDV